MDKWMVLALVFGFVVYVVERQQTETAYVQQSQANAIAVINGGAAGPNPVEAPIALGSPALGGGVAFFVLIAGVGAHMGRRD